MGAPQDRRDDARGRAPGVHLDRGAGATPSRGGAATVRVPRRPQVLVAAAQARVPRPATGAEPGLADGLLRVRDRPRWDLADLRGHRPRHQVLPRGYRHPDVSRRRRAHLPTSRRRRGKRVLDLDDLRADRGETDVVDAEHFVIGQVPAPVALVTDNGPCFLAAPSPRRSPATTRCLVTSALESGARRPTAWSNGSSAP